jgi:hypothetical protein
MKNVFPAWLEWLAKICLFFSDWVICKYMLIPQVLHILLLVQENLCKGKLIQHTISILGVCESDKNDFYNL